GIQVKGILFDMPEVISRAEKDERWKTLQARYPNQPKVEFVPGSFFNEEEIPFADVYVMRMIIHDWLEEKAVEILKKVRNRMQAGRGSAAKRLVLVEQVLPEEGQKSGMYPISSEVVDMLMMTM